MASQTSSPQGMSIQGSSGDAQNFPEWHLAREQQCQVHVDTRSLLTAGPGDQPAIVADTESSLSLVCMRTSQQQHARLLLGQTGAASLIFNT